MEGATNTRGDRSAERCQQPLTAPSTSDYISRRNPPFLLDLSLIHFPDLPPFRPVDLAWCCGRIVVENLNSRTCLGHSVLPTKSSLPIAKPDLRRIQAFIQQRRRLTAHHSGCLGALLPFNTFDCLLSIRTGVQHQTDP